MKLAQRCLSLSPAGPNSESLPTLLAADNQSLLWNNNLYHSPNQAAGGVRRWDIEEFLTLPPANTVPDKIAEYFSRYHPPQAACYGIDAACPPGSTPGSG